MSRTMEEIAAEAEAMRAGDEPEIDEVEGFDEEDEIENKSPPGFKSYEQYVADGGDPDMYKGKKAYEAEKKRIDENKKLHSDVRDLKKSTEDMAQTFSESMAEWQKGQREAMRKELEAKLKEQKDTYDLDGAFETKEALDNLKRDEKKQDKAPKLNPVIVQFTEENPILDRDSDQFNQEFFDDMARLQAKKINAMSDNGGADLTSAQILKCTRAAFEDAKELNRGLFVSDRNDRSGVARKKSPTSGGDDKGKSLETRLRAMKVQSSYDHEGLNKNAVFEMYEVIKAKDPKAAEKFARAQLGERA